MRCCNWGAEFVTVRGTRTGYLNHAGGSSPLSTPSTKPGYSSSVGVYRRPFSSDLRLFGYETAYGVATSMVANVPAGPCVGSSSPPMLPLYETQAVEACTMGLVDV